MNRNPTPRQLTMIACEDVQGGAAEMRERLGTVWALPLTPAVLARVRRRALELESACRTLRRELDRMEEAA